MIVPKLINRSQPFMQESKERLHSGIISQSGHTGL